VNGSRRRCNPIQLIAVALLSVAAIVVSGCARTSQPLLPADADLQHDPELRVRFRAPAGWCEDPVRVDRNSRQRVWISPTGDTAFGIIRFDLPVPVGHDLALWGFLRTMRRDDGQADLVEKRWDEQRQVLRFVVEGKTYRLRALLHVRSFGGWSVYAGSLRERPENLAEIEQAEQSRERTVFDE
jgi:hypothetical protein